MKSSIWKLLAQASLMDVKISRQGKKGEEAADPKQVRGKRNKANKPSQQAMKEKNPVERQGNPGV